ncbi:MAG: GTPase HflX [Candidatus Bathyarchaeota archaeon]|uniref:GTPase HflX n=1 Tax=Candidatus Bathycorpusculum sp. TaxID=2994959 RepID=UPI002820978F|nr:GTPase HflX [Candidatus Termiticorpusculum sp.]MCL2257598.1 GTPase HflX [Candidatus Termiticorpusculum sp.]MCL2292253.1 GTPase HflX [Candidatus Termiticorpusculum sp.]
MAQRRLNREPSSLEELKALAQTAGYTIVGSLEQTRPPDARYQIGAGKVEELVALVKDTGASKVIFDNSLRMLQNYNLAKATKVEVIDRFQLILEIFARRATTTEAQLQIQLATVQNELRHAREKVRLCKGSEQPGFMGLGVYEADVYRDAIKLQVQTILKKLAAIRTKRILQRERRTELGFLSVSLAGYTSAGKSTLFNALTAAEAMVDKTLFTTLSTTTRIIEFSNREFLLTDTVGFIDRLPISLIEAFHSTLEETIYSDLIILVIDLKEPLEVIEKKIDICQDTINRLNAGGIPQITALNKIDRLSPEELEQKLDALKGKIQNPILLSAKKQTNLDMLKAQIVKMLENYVQGSFSVALTGEVMSFISWVHEKAEVKKEEFLGDHAEVKFEANPQIAEQIRKKVEKFNGKYT